LNRDRVNRIRFRAWRRGFREADLILGPFADTHVPQMSNDELDELERLLDQSDQDLYGWIIGREPTPEAFDTPMMTRIKGFLLLARDARPDLGA
jgi:antitoxin CptB